MSEDDKKAAVDACIAMAGSIIHGIKDAQNYGHISNTEAFDMAYEAMTMPVAPRTRVPLVDDPQEPAKTALGQWITQKLQVDKLLETEDE